MAETSLPRRVLLNLFGEATEKQASGAVDFTRYPLVRRVMSGLFNVPLGSIAAETTDLQHLNEKFLDVTGRPQYLRDLSRARMLDEWGQEPYIARDFDQALSEVLIVAAMQDRARVVFIVGKTGSGKTQSAVRAMLEALPNRRLLAPKRFDLETLDAIAQFPEDTLAEAVVWIDVVSVADPSGWRPVGDPREVMAALEKLAATGAVVLVSDQHPELDRLAKYSPHAVVFEVPGGLNATEALRAISIGRAHFMPTLASIRVPVAKRAALEDALVNQAAEYHILVSHRFRNVRESLPDADPGPWQSILEFTAQHSNDLMPLLEEIQRFVRQNRSDPVLISVPIGEDDSFFLKVDRDAELQIDRRR